MLRRNFLHLFKISFFETVHEELLVEVNVGEQVILHFFTVAMPKNGRDVPQKILILAAPTERH